MRNSFVRIAPTVQEWLISVGSKLGDFSMQYGWIRVSYFIYKGLFGVQISYATPHESLRSSNLIPHISAIYLVVCSSLGCDGKGLNGHHPLDLITPQSTLFSPPRRHIRYIGVRRDRIVGLVIIS